MILRYKDAEQAFQRSCHLDDEEMALTDRLSAYKGVVEQLVSHFNVESEPSVYAESFERLSTWVDNALDMYRVSGGQHTMAQCVSASMPSCQCVHSNKQAFVLMKDRACNSHAASKTCIPYWSVAHSWILKSLQCYSSLGFHAYGPQG
eukprot:1161545-Pelagomonas_calceolata.AAC.2